MSALPLLITKLLKKLHLETLHRLRRERLMAKRNRRSNRKVINRRLKEGRGKGRGEKYLPFLFIQDVASIGLATRDKGWITGRVHHFLSKLEWLFFLTLEWVLDIIDIREQYPLDLDETLAIAKRLGISHPVDPKTREPIMMTTDFVITVRTPTGIIELARTVKYKKDLASLRVMEKFEIERVYWQSRGVDWKIITEQDIDLILAANVKWLHRYRWLHAIAPITEETIQRVEAVLRPQLTEENELPLRYLTDVSDLNLGLPPGTSLVVVRYLLANRIWEVDMSNPIQPCTKMILLAKTYMS